MDVIAHPLLEIKTFPRYTINSVPRCIAKYPCEILPGIFLMHAMRKVDGSKSCNVFSCRSHIPVKITTYTSGIAQFCIAPTGAGGRETYRHQNKYARESLQIHGFFYG
jgi:hypothetical protein